MLRRKDKPLVPIANQVNMLVVAVPPPACSVLLEVWLGRLGYLVVPLVLLANTAVPTRVPTARLASTATRVHLFALNAQLVGIARSQVVCSARQVDSVRIVQASVQSAPLENSAAQKQVPVHNVLEGDIVLVVLDLVRIARLESLAQQAQAFVPSVRRVRSALL
jgi:hypothetical protein